MSAVDEPVGEAAVPVDSAASRVIAAAGRDEPSVAEQRSVLLCNMPVLLGSSWALGWRESMRAEGRVVMGGWPGTLPEARARVVAEVSAELSRRGLSPLSHAETVALASVAYNRAKRDWTQAVRTETSQRREGRKTDSRRSER